MAQMDRTPLTQSFRSRPLQKCDDESTIAGVNKQKIAYGQSQSLLDIAAIGIDQEITNFLTQSESGRN